ncbi:hypothetical protein WN943_008336 [Citrus x changshan-huyou]
MPFTTTHLRLISPLIHPSSPSIRSLVSANTKPFRLSASSAAMDSNSSCMLVLSGKSLAENEIAESLKSNSTLKLPDNSEVSIHLQSEIVKQESFDVELFMNSLATNRFGRLLIWSPRLPSTHDVVSHNFCELPVGAVCVADVQFKGRGRSKNAWESPKGCLMFSFTIQMEDGRVVPLLQYVASLALTEAINYVCSRDGLPCLDIKIKWPNDLYLNGIKVGGILCTSTYRTKKFNVSIGIGLNVNNEEPTTCLNAVLRKLSDSTYQFRREDVIAAFFNKFETFYDTFINQGFQTLEELYYKTWLHSGQRVIVQEKNEDQAVENVVTIQFLLISVVYELYNLYGSKATSCLEGLTSSGYLLAIGDDNQMCELHPDGNSQYLWISTGRHNDMGIVMTIQICICIIVKSKRSWSKSPAGDYALKGSLVHRFKPCAGR